jgi:hypothetical protein
MSTPSLPGVNLPNPPALPGVGAPQPTAAERAAVENKWKALAGAPKILADLILLVADHPELIEWAKASKAGTVRFSDR